MKEFSPNHFFDLKNFENADIFEGIGLVWQALEKLEEYIKKKPQSNTSIQTLKNVYIDNPSLVFVHESCTIEPGAYLKGPCVIGRGTTVRHGAYIRENVLIGSDCVVGHDTEIKNSILLNNVQAAHFNYVGDSILGNYTRLGAGAKCANLRLDEKAISVFYSSKKIDTHLKKLGVIMGDHSQVGCNCVLNPGTFLGKGVICYPCLHILGYIESGQTVKKTSL